MTEAKDQSKRAKYSKEVEKIKGMRDINRILKASDMENALLSNSAKDSETLNDNVLDSMLSKADSYDQDNIRGLEAIERLTTTGGGRVVKQKVVRVTRSKGRVKVRRKIHMVKRAKPRKAKAKGKAKRRRR